MKYPYSHPNKTKAIVSTSSACFSEIFTPHNVFNLPINVHIGDELYLDGYNISIEELSKQLIDNPNLPAYTSAPDEGQLIEFFFELVEQGIDEIMVITISSYLSQTYQTIRSIQSIFGKKLTIHLFDSRSISHGEAVLVYEAAQLLDKGHDFPEITRRLNQLRQQMYMYITVDNLRAMVRTKRVSAPAGFFANLLDIKPIVFMEGTGKLVPHQKIRGFEESVYRVVELIAEQSAGKQGSFYTACNEINPYLPLLNRTIKDFGFKKVVNVPLASVCVANVGVYALGMMFVENYFDS